MNADIAAKIRLYLDFDHIIKIKTHTNRYLRPSAVHIEMLSSPQSVLILLHSPAAPASALYPATAARQGGSVAASRVDSSEFRTADERG